jgi:hypothetical protein
MSFWCDADKDIKPRLEGIGGATTDSAVINEYIARAQTEIKSELSGTYSITTMIGWDSAIPPRIKQLTADLATLLYLKDKSADFSGRVGDSQSTYSFMKRVREGEIEIFTSANTIIARISRTSPAVPITKTAKFSMGDEIDGSIGTLDDY